jgi:hypothetical protein
MGRDIQITGRVASIRCGNCKRMSSIAMGPFATVLPSLDD